MLCKKIAKKRKLRCSGNRNVLGTLLGLRNDEWSRLALPQDEHLVSSQSPMEFQADCRILRRAIPVPPAVSPGVSGALPRALLGARQLLGWSILVFNIKPANG